MSKTKIIPKYMFSDSHTKAVYVKCECGNIMNIKDANFCSKCGRELDKECIK